MNWGDNTCVGIVVTHQYLGKPVQVRRFTEQTYSGHSGGTMIALMLSVPDPMGVGLVQAF